MNTKQIIGNQVSESAVSATLILFSALWLAAACEYYATSGLKMDWSATPLFWMLAVVITPAICFAGCMMLFDRRKRIGQPFDSMQSWALAAAFLPITLGSLLSVWAVRVLFSMSGL